MLRQLTLALMAGVLFLAPAARSQGFGNIVGTVTDPSGAVIANAKVTATETETGVSRALLTSSVSPGARFVCTARVVICQSALRKPTRSTTIAIGDGGRCTGFPAVCTGGGSGETSDETRSLWQGSAGIRRRFFRP